MRYAEIWVSKGIEEHPHDISLAGASRAGSEQKECSLKLENIVK